ncbi:MAG TPA: amidase family protein [Candidatus Nanopelagicales bacterium]|nr:amidase family protein [Candidatus Nanopelagicales bacterium]
MTATTSTDWTASAIATGVRTRQRAAVDTVREALDRLDARDGDLAAFQVVRREAALREAAAVDGAIADGAARDAGSLPLAGVPIAVKDNVPVEGEPMRSGSAATPAHPQLANHEVVRRLRHAGAVVVGITRLPELGVFGATDSVYGVTRNPWDLDRTPGGSSGGSAAAVAAGIVPVAHGNDGMGSVRIPAACTGLVGIKPGSGVVPADLGENAWFGLTENGVLSTTVADAALVLSVMADDPTIAAASDAADGPELRIAVSTRPPVQGVKVDVEHVRALFRAAVDLMHDGHTVERHDPSYPPSVAIGALTRWFAGTALEVDGLDESLLEPRVRTHARIGRFVIDRGLVKDGARDAWIASSTELLTTYDVLMTPVLATPPIAAKRWGDTSWAATMMSNVPFAPFAAPWNLAGFPAMSVPAGIHPEYGTPLSVQLVARPGRERTLLAVARSMERLRPWPRTAPAYAD